ncbi:hypothetical protein OG613_44495 (plasmid) [Streptomyces sp. NBC_00015]|uniref:hypothetical protein n=1 Tax=Streptomyces sp. NBC_00015 TaxID=2903611 RepID=UPI002F91A721
MWAVGPSRAADSAVAGRWLRNRTGRRLRRTGAVGGGPGAQLALLRGIAQTTKRCAIVLLRNSYGA